jgi:aminoglycoside phosphotransferase (APT) family kinase protein
MPFITKTPLDFASAQKIVQHYFGAHTQLGAFTELTEGMYNSAYLLDLGEGQKLVMKVAPSDSVRVLRYEQNIMTTEVEVLRMVKQHTEMPVPDVLCYDTSRTLIPNNFYLMDFVPGVSFHKLRPQFSAQEQERIDRQTGIYLRQVNQIRGVGFGLFAFPDQLAPTWREGFNRLFQDVLADGQEYPVELALPYEEISARVAARYDNLDEVQAPCLVHWDLWDGNIFVDPETKQITGYIDFERALWADPLMEVNFGAFGENPAFLAGYGLEMLDTNNKRCRRTLYNIYLFLIMIIETYYRHFANNGQEMWAREMLRQQLERLEEF